MDPTDPTNAPAGSARHSSTAPAFAAVAYNPSTIGGAGPEAIYTGVDGPAVRPAALRSCTW